MTRSDLERLGDAHERAIEIIALAKRHGVNVVLETRELFQSMLFDVIVIGEALNNVSGYVQTLVDDVPWRQATDTRNRFVHGYWSIDPSYLVGLIENDLPMLIGALARLMAMMEREA